MVCSVEAKERCFSSEGAQLSKRWLGCSRCLSCRFQRDSRPEGTGDADCTVLEVVVVSRSSIRMQFLFLCRSRGRTVAGKQVLASILPRNFLMEGNQPVSRWGREMLVFAKIEKETPA